MQRPRSKKYTRLFHTLTPCVLLIVLCMGFFLCPVTSQASELTSSGFPLSPEIFYLRAYDVAEDSFEYFYPIFNSNNLATGRISASVSSSQTTWWYLEFQFADFALDLDDKYGGVQADSVSMSLSWDVEMDSEVTENGNKGVFVDLSYVYLWFDSWANRISIPYTYTCTYLSTSYDHYHCELSIDVPVDPASFDARTIGLSIHGANTLKQDDNNGGLLNIRPYGGSMTVTYYHDTVNDEINSNLENMQDALTTPSSDFASDVTDFNESVDSAISDIMDQEQEWQDSIEAIYESYGVDPDSMEYKFKDVVVDLRAEATTGWLSDLWNFFKDYKFLYLFLNTGLVFCMIVFLLRR